MSRRRGVSMLEVMIAVLVLVLAIVPMIGLFSSGRESAHMSEHQIYAELMSVRAEEELSTLPWERLRSTGPIPDYVTRIRQDDDRSASLRNSKEYQASLAGPQPIRMQVTVTPVGSRQGFGAGTGRADEIERDGDGLLAVRVSARWGDIREVDLKQSQYHVVRLRAKRDFGLRSIPGATLD